MDAEPAPHEVGRWWQAMESGDSARAPVPEWLDLLGRIHDAELDLRIAEARKLLAAAQGIELARPWDDVRRLLSLRVGRHERARELRELLPRLQAFLDEEEVDPATRGRGFHLLGVVHVRLDRHREALLALRRGLELVADDRARTWMLDTAAQALIGLGAWTEARRTLRVVWQRKERLGDVRSLAIAAGHEAGLHLMLGLPREAERVLEQTLNTLGERLEVASRINLRNRLVEAYLECEEHDKARTAARSLGAAVGDLGGTPEGRPSLLTFSHIVLARVAALDRRQEDVEGHLAAALECAALPDQEALAHYWQARLVPGLLDSEDWNAGVEGIFWQSKRVSEAEVLIHLLRAEHAAGQGQEARRNAHLGRANDRAMASNNPALIQRIDRTLARLDPSALARHVARRFSGQDPSELEKTTEEEVTIVFADLMDFSLRCQELEAEEVMDTVRGLFELCVVQFTRHKVRPLQHLGDGLLAVCQGPDHRQRGLRFACKLIELTRSVTAVRHALGDAWGLQLRAGIASGPVVLGPLGSHYKREYLAIGRTTNLAARLQARAGPGEILAQAAVCEGLGGELQGVTVGDLETLELKGFDVPQHARRIRP